MDFDVLGGGPEIVEVALRVLLQVRRDRQPDGPLVRVQEAVENDAGDRATLPDARPVPYKETRAVPTLQDDVVPLARVYNGLELQGREVALRDYVFR